MYRKIATDRLILRPVREGDAGLIAAYLVRNRSFFDAWTPLYEASFFTEDYQQRLLAQQLDLMLEGRLFRFIIFHQMDKRQCCVLGDITYSQIQKGVAQSAFLAYKIDETIVRQGYAMEAVSATNAYMFKYFKLHRLEASIMPQNIASIRLIEKLGFEQEGLSKKLLKINGQWEDHYRYALINPFIS